MKQYKWVFNVLTVVLLDLINNPLRAFSCVQICKHWCSFYRGSGPARTVCNYGGSGDD